MYLAQNIQEALTRAGGKTLQGKPKYKFMWSADFTYLISNGSKYERFRVVAEDCWILVKYETAESGFWGTGEAWEINNWEPSGLLTAGPFPRQGRYRNIIKIKTKIILADGQEFYVNCAPTLDWVRDYFPGLRDFLELSTKEKAQYLIEKDKREKEALSKAFAASRENYRGVASQKQIKDKEAALERWISDEAAVAQVQELAQNRKQVN